MPLLAIRDPGCLIQVLSNQRVSKGEVKGRKQVAVLHFDKVEQAWHALRSVCKPTKKMTNFLSMRDVSPIYVWLKYSLGHLYTGIHILKEMAEP